jgi:hypothetical protein
VAGKPLLDAAEIKNRRKLYQSLERGLAEREQRIRHLDVQERLTISTDDLGWVFEDLYHGRTTIPPHAVLSKPYAVRWEREREVSEDNLVIMSGKDGERHEEECLVGGKGVEEVWGKEVVQLVKRKSEEARRIVAYRRG